MTLKEQRFRFYASFLLVPAIVLIVAYMSIWILGDDNPVEEVAEEVIEDTIEQKLNLPHGSIDIDLSKDK